MDILFAFVALTIFTLMLTIGVNQSFAQLTSLWHQPAALARALFAVLVLVPAVVIGLLFAFDLSPAVATALALLAAAPGAPLTAKRSQLAAADVDYTTSLQLTLALLAALATPLILAVFYALFELNTERVSPFEVAEQIVRVTFLPVIIGLTLQHFAPRLVATIQKPLNILANGLFLLLVIVIVVVLAITPELRSGLLLGWTAIAVILVTGAAALAIGHILGGPGLERRAGLAVASLARNIGLALFVGGLSGGQSGFLPILLAYMLLGTAVAIPYSIWIKRRIG